jgi:Fe-S cluster assembly protein SufB
VPHQRYLPEVKFLAGVSAQDESDVVYHNIHQDLVDRGIIFADTDSTLRDYPEFFREYFGTVIPAEDDKFAALIRRCGLGRSFRGSVSDASLIVLPDRLRKYGAV